MRGQRYVVAAIAACLLWVSPAGAEPAPNRAKAKATVEFFIPLLLDDSSHQTRVSNCHRITPDTWACGLSWTQRPDSAVRMRCRATVIDEPDWVYIAEPTVRCRERRSATRRLGMRARGHARHWALAATKPLPDSLPRF